ncbi:MAG: PilZ domain-containing protein [Proteobacteria bacterium]|nr:MAG: PilZ domain-containing protein [Pseudomonadota bacterium]
MRNYLRHPTSISIEIAVIGESSAEVTANNLSEGGLCFVSESPVKVGSVIDLRIPHVTEDYICEGVIVWQREQQTNEFEVGVRFANDDEYNRIRMVEQVCQIEDYRQNLAAKGRALTPDAAAIEWIERYAADFDQDVIS